MFQGQSETVLLKQFRYHHHQILIAGEYVPENICLIMNVFMITILYSIRAHVVNALKQTIHDKNNQHNRDDRQPFSVIDA